MAIPLSITITATGADVAQRAVANVASSVRQLQTAIQPNAGAASAWNPYISSLRRLQAAQAQASDAAKKQQANLQPNAGAASAWNPFISQLRRVEAAERAAADEAKKLAQANSQAISSGAASAWSPQIGAVKQYEYALRQATDAERKLKDERAKSKENLTKSRNFGAGALAVGAVADRAIWNATTLAGDFDRKRKAISTYEGGDKLFEELKDYDLRSPFDFNQVSGQAQSALTKGFKAGEIIPLFDTLGDSIAKAGGDVQNFNAAIRQIGQIKSKGKASMQDLNALSEGGGIAVIPILEKELGKERVKGILSGDEPISADELLPALFKGMRERDKGGMAQYMETLPGQLEQLNGQWQMLSIEVMQHLLPAAKLLVGILSGVTGFFRGLPGPLKAVIAYGAAFTFGIVTLGGAALVAAAQIGLAKIALGETGFATLLAPLKALGGGISTVSSGITTNLIPALTGSGGLAGVLSVALPLAIAAGIALMFKAAADAQNAAEDQYYKDTEPGKDLGDGTTKESAIKQAQDFERRAQDIDKAIQVRKDAKAISWPINLKTGKTPAQYQDEIDNLEMERKGYLDMAAKRRAKANSLPSATASQAATTAATSAATAAASPDLPMTAIAGVSGAAGGGNVESLEGEIETLTRQMRTADKDEKKAISDQLFEKRLQLKHARAAAAANRRSTSVAERDRKKAERAAAKAEKENIDNDQLEYDVKATEVEESFNTRIAELEARRDAAREAKNEAQEAALKFEIDKLQAERDYALAKIHANQTGLEDEKKRDAMMRIAEAKKRGALQRAQIAFNSAKNKGLNLNALRGGGVLPGLPAGLATRAAELYNGANSGMFNPYGEAGATYRGEDASTPFARMIGAPQVPNRTAELGRNIRNSARDWIVKAKTELEQSANGKNILKIIVPDVEMDNPAAAMGGRI